MSHELKLSSEFPFATGAEQQFSYLGPKDLHIQIEATTHTVAREVGQGIARAMEDGLCPTGKVAALGYIKQANEKQMPLSCTFSYDLA